MSTLWQTYSDRYPHGLGKRNVLPLWLKLLPVTIYFNEPKLLLVIESFVITMVFSFVLQSIY